MIKKENSTLRILKSYIKNINKYKDKDIPIDWLYEWRMMLIIYANAQKQKYYADFCVLGKNNTGMYWYRVLKFLDGKLIKDITTDSIDIVWNELSEWNKENNNE